MKVLVVDAAAAVRSRLVALLAESGITIVGEAATSERARELVASCVIDAVVLDVDLPDRGGLALISDLHAQSIEIVVITNALSYRRRCLMLGASSFLDKSSDFAAVSSMLLELGKLAISPA